MNLLKRYAELTEWDQKIILHWVDRWRAKPSFIEVAFLDIDEVRRAGGRYLNKHFGADWTKSQTWPTWCKLFPEEEP